MRLLDSITWEEIFSEWKKRESTDPSWIKCATETKGWPDWESWRRFTATQLGAENLNWEIYEFSDPMEEIPAMLMGPYTGWQSRVSEKNKLSFADLVEIPEQFEYWSKVDKINSMLADFPEVDMIGLIRNDNAKLVCIEGHHSSTAVAIARKLGQKIEFKKPIRIAIAHIPADQVDLFERVLARGTTKDPE